MSEQQTLSITAKLQNALVNIQQIADELDGVDVTNNHVIQRLLGRIEFFAHVSQMSGVEPC
jgi:hypothetical protein